MHFFPSAVPVDVSKTFSHVLCGSVDTMLRILGAIT